jgi:hypothetical protein
MSVVWRFTGRAFDFYSWELGAARVISDVRSVIFVGCDLFSAENRPISVVSVTAVTASYSTVTGANPIPAWLGHWLVTELQHYAVFENPRRTLGFRTLNILKTFQLL